MQTDKTTFLGIDAPQRIPSLDGLRAVSIAAVLWAHLVGTKGFIDAPRTHGWDIGTLGVRVFFVISGFLITTLLLNEQRRRGSIDLKWFYFRRTMRIFPALYFFLAVLAVGVAISALAIPTSQFVYALTYTVNYVTDPDQNIGHLWSLAVEEQFYLLWPATLAVLGISRGLKVAAGVVVISPLIRFAFLYIPAARPLIDWSFPTIADPLAIGCLLAGMSTRLGRQSWYMGFLRSSWFWVAPVLIPVLNALPGTKLNLLITQSLINVCIAISIDRFVRIQGGVVWQFLNWLPVRCMGVLSYSIYLWQQPFINHLAHGQWNSFPLNLLGALVCGYCSYRFVEKPFLNLRIYCERRWKKESEGPKVSIGKTQGLNASRGVVTT